MNGMHKAASCSFSIYNKSGGVCMKKWAVPSMVTVSAEKLGDVMVASACTLYNGDCVLVRSLGV